MTPPDFVVIGHVVEDIAPEGWRLGGTATFAAIQALRLGLQVGVVTRVHPDMPLQRLLPDVAIAGRPSTCTTTFENIYTGARRRQRVPFQAEPLAEDDVPLPWRDAPIVLIGPVCGEAPATLATRFPNSLVAVGAQGWLRRLTSQRTVRRRAWTAAPFWSGAHVLFVSDEDLGRRHDQLARWAADVPIVVHTRDERGARVYDSGRWRSIAAFPVTSLDPTGAGDVFAAAFLVRYYETEHVAESARFAAAAASCSVEAPGTEGILGRAEIEARMASHPEVLLQ